MNQDSFKKLISGQKTGLTATLIRMLLAFLSILYCTAVSVRNLLYSLGILKVSHASLPVISIGNITAGGTGKTPMVIAICKILQSKHHNPAVLTRGYKSTNNPSANIADEPELIARHCPNVQVIVNPDRVSGAAQATLSGSPDVLILDDGFQHRRLYRDLNIVAIDATLPFGYGKVLPAGLLREPLTGLKRAHAAIITRSNSVTELQLQDIEKRITAINPDTLIIRSIHQPIAILAADDRRLDLSTVKNARVFAFSGIGNPDAFKNTLLNLGCDLVGWQVFDDHHHYQPAEITEILTQATAAHAQFVLTTEKDWTKITLPQNASADIIFACLPIELTITKNAALFDKLIQSTVTSNSI